METINTTLADAAAMAIGRRGEYNEAYYDYMGRRMREEDKKEDAIKRPSHYSRWKIEPVTFIMRNDMEFWRGNIIKYASRAGYKNYPEMDKSGSEITDLQKVIRYAEMRINQLKGEVEL